MFITFEGLDGSGKTTQINRLKPYLQECGYNVEVTREPGGTDFGEHIRDLLMQHATLSARTELLLFCASRAELVDKIINPHLHEAPSNVMISDRFADSTLAYQGYGHKLDIKALKSILTFTTGGLTPDFTFYLHIKPEEGIRRRNKMRLLGEEWNRMDDMKRQFYYDVLNGYHSLMKEQPNRWIYINAAQPIEKVQAEIRVELEKRLEDMQSPKPKSQAKSNEPQQLSLGIPTQ